VLASLLPAPLPAQVTPLLFASNTAASEFTHVTLFVACDVAAAFRPISKVTTFTLSSSVLPMKILCSCLAAVVLFPAPSEAATLHFQVTDSPPDALTYSAEVYHATAYITGTFAIAVAPGQDADLHDVNLRLTDVAGSSHLAVADLEGKSLQSLLPVDLESLPSTSTATEFFFGETFTGIPSEPWASMKVDLSGRQAVVTLAAMLYPINTLDGATAVFKPVLATIVPEPSAMALGAFGLIALGFIRRRHIA
jgi:MYXO-CTERM domain-containing protein